MKLQTFVLLLIITQVFCQGWMNKTDSPYTRAEKLLK